ncbi:hypothetical protein ACLOJK_028411 [Asimina triloba]
MLRWVKKERFEDSRSRKAELSNYSFSIATWAALDVTALGLEVNAQMGESNIV